MRADPHLRHRVPLPERDRVVLLHLVVHGDGEGHAQLIRAGVPVEGEAEV